MTADLSCEVRSLDDLGIQGEAPEPYATFRENALAKAVFYNEAASLPVLADDSGLMVDALGGAPGVRSARFMPGSSQAAKNDYLAALARKLPEEKRGALFVCQLVLIDPPDPPISCRGTVAGRLAPEPRGEGGFGYDPVFYVPESGRTMAEMSPEEKDKFSHRGRALRRFLDALRQDPERLRRLKGSGGHEAADPEDPGTRPQRR